MEERDLLVAMRQAVAAAPPPMSDEPVLSAARHALRRRRAVLASAGSAVAVAVVAVGVFVFAPSEGVRVGDQPPAPSSTEKKSRTSSYPTDATVTAGPQYDQGVAIAAALDDLAPAGYETPGDLKGVDDFADRTLKSHSVLHIGASPDVWTYSAATPLTKGDGVGELLAVVYSPGGPTGAGCALTPTAWDATVADCAEVMVAGKRVAVADIPARDGLPPAQWAGYRHPDGTVVFVMQTAQVPRSGRPALDAMPMTGAQLAAMAVHPRLKPS